MKNKKNTKKIIKNAIELLIEILIFFLVHLFLRIEKTMAVSFGRYLFIFLTLYFILRDRYHNNLIWQDAKNMLIFYLVLFVISLVVKPMKELTINKILLNLLFMLISFMLVLFAKKILHTVFFRQLANNVLIIGTGDHAETIAQVCGNNRYSLMNVKGFLSCNNKNFEIKQELVVKDNIVKYKDLDNFIDTNDIDVALIAIPQISKSDIIRLYEDLRNKVNTIKYMPQINSMYSYDTRIEDYDGLLLVCNKEVNNNLYLATFKRLIDIVAGIVGCIVLLPLTLVLKICYVLNGDNHPLFFKQERIGLNGKKIVIYKYRSMIPNAETVLEELMKNDKNIRNEYLKNKKLENDPRITKVGHLIRRTSIDEFPQFINVLKGEMSLVGPRPYLFREIEDMGTFYDSIILTKPGITGMWQVSGRSDISFDRRCRLDEYYAKNQSLWLDFTIVIKTIKAVLSSSGAI